MVGSGGIILPPSRPKPKFSRGARVLFGAYASLAAFNLAVGILAGDLVNYGAAAVCAVLAFLWCRR